MPQPKPSNQPGTPSSRPPARGTRETPPPRPLLHWERDARNQRLLYLGAAALGALVVAILIGGWVLDTVVRANATVATVQGEAITASQVVDEMRPTVSMLEAQVRELGGASGGSVLQQQLDQQKRALPDDALDTLIEARLIRHEADRRGLSVTPEEIDARVREDVAQVEALMAPQPTPTPGEPTPEAAPAVGSPTPEGGVAAASPTPTPFATPTPVPTLAPDAQREALKRQLDRVGLTEERYRTLVERDLLRQKVSDAIGAEVPASQEQVHARHILVGSEDKANEILQKLNEGASFEDLARQESTDPGSKDKGGDLGWFPRGIMNSAFETAAFSLEPGQRSGVVSSPNGYHIIEVLERDPNRPVAPDQLETLRAQAFSTWFSSAQFSPDVQRDFSADERDWALRQIGVRP